MPEHSDGRLRLVQFIYYPADGDLEPRQRPSVLLTWWRVGIIALVGAIYLPALQGILKTVPLNLWDWSIIFGLGLIELVLIETTKWYFIVKKQYD